MKDCTVALSTVDMLSVGQSLRSLARSPKTPHGVREAFDRVGTEMMQAALGVIQKAGAR